MPAGEGAGWDRPTMGVVLAGFCAFLGFYVPQPLLPMLSGLFGVSHVAVSLTITLATAGVALAAPLIGLVADRFGRKRVIVTSAILLALATLGAATADGLRPLLAWRFLQGICTPGVFAVTVAYIQEEWAGRGAGSATAAYVTGTVIGGFTGRFTSGLVATRWNWHLSFVTAGLVGLAAAVLLWRWLPCESRFVRRAGDRSTFASASDHVRNRRLIATFAAGFCVLFSLLGVFTYITFYLAAPPFRLRPSGLGSLFFVYLIGAVVTPLCGRQIDRYGHRLSLSAAIGVSITGVLLTLGQSLWIVIAGLAFCCTGVFVAQSAANSFIGIATTHSKALAVGMYVTFYYAGGSLGAVLPGYLWTRYGWPGCVALFVGVQLITVAIALAWWTAPGGEEDRKVVESITSAG
jgi:MFS transporter, YNFM family, putative membrane transport protein